MMTGCDESDVLRCWELAQIPLSFFMKMKQYLKSEAFLFRQKY